MYNTISKDVLHTIMKPDATTMKLWQSLEAIFQDNKHTRTVYLEEQFTNTHLRIFTNVADYCKQLIFFG